MSNIPDHITYQSYAKINLYLDVLNKRDDGFHAIETIFQTISLADTLTFALTDSEITITVDGADLPTDDQNLVIRAANSLRDHYGTILGVNITLTKAIPIAAGLAGGSGNAAAAFIALNQLWNIGASTHDLQQLAAQLGSDIPYCLIGGTMAGTSRGEILEPVAPLKPTWFILAHPQVAVSTPVIYNHPQLAKSGGVPGANGRTQAFDNAIEKCRVGDLENIFYNAMEPAATHDFPIINDYKKRLTDAGCNATLMSGSGPTVFGLCRDEAHARAIQSTLNDIKTTVVHTVNHGIEVVE